eukprot:2869287-Alexandrium_andersonii.AAC.1
MRKGKPCGPRGAPAASPPAPQRRSSAPPIEASGHPAATHTSQTRQLRASPVLAFRSVASRA